MKKPISVLLQYLLPQHLLSRTFALLANSHCLFIKTALIKWFIKRYGVDLSIAEKEEVADYVSFNDFFTRYLKPGARPIATDEQAIISPVDGVVSQVGTVNQGQIIQAKGMQYELTQLLAGIDYAQNFMQGTFATLYLSPKDYHRVHMPIAGKLISMTYVPGKLFSVNTATANEVPNLYTRNERLICMFETDIGMMSIVLVGAMLVAGINTVWDGQVAPNRKRIVQTWEYSDRAIFSSRGDEIGHFAMGSTVILLFEQGKVQMQTDLLSGEPIRMGEAIGIIV